LGSRFFCFFLLYAPGFISCCAWGNPQDLFGTFVTPLPELAYYKVAQRDLDFFPGRCCERGIRMADITTGGNNKTFLVFLILILLLLGDWF
jgi:hypothetical protein